MNSEIPQGEYVNGFYVIKDLALQLEFGLCSGPANIVALESRKFNNDIFLSRSSEKRCTPASCKSVSALLSLKAKHGAKLTLMVQDVPGTNPEKIAGNFYLALTNLNFYPNFPVEVSKTD